jgi:septal ring factor EnvC (AmiA/AmiB activator)
MGDRRCKIRAGGRHVTFAAALLVLGLTAACSSGPSQKELALLEEQHQAMVSAEKMLAQKKAEEARLQRKLADKKAEQKAAEEKQAATADNLANFPKE